MLGQRGRLSNKPSAYDVIAAHKCTDLTEGEAFGPLKSTKIYISPMVLGGVDRRLGRLQWPVAAEWNMKYEKRIVKLEPRRFEWSTGKLSRSRLANSVLVSVRTTLASLSYSS